MKNTMNFYSIQLILFSIIILVYDPYVKCETNLSSGFVLESDYSPPSSNVPEYSRDSDDTNTKVISDDSGSNNNYQSSTSRPASNRHPNQNQDTSEWPSANRLSQSDRNIESNSNSNGRNQNNNARNHQTTSSTNNQKQNNNQNQHNQNERSENRKLNDEPQSALSLALGIPASTNKNTIGGGASSTGNNNNNGNNNKNKQKNTGATNSGTEIKPQDRLLIKIEGGDDDKPITLNNNKQSPIVLPLRGGDQKKGQSITISIQEGNKNDPGSAGTAVISANGQQIVISTDPKSNKPVISLGGVQVNPAKNNQPTYNNEDANSHPSPNDYDQQGSSNQYSTAKPQAVNEYDQQGNNDQYSTPRPQQPLISALVKPFRPAVQDERPQVRPPTNDNNYDYGSNNQHSNNNNNAQRPTSRPVNPPPYQDNSGYDSQPSRPINNPVNSNADRPYDSKPSRPVNDNNNNNEDRPNYDSPPIRPNNNNADRPNYDSPPPPPRPSNNNNNNNNQDNQYDNQQQPPQRPQQPEAKYKLNEEGCGLAQDTRIVGGEEADPGDYVWMAALIKSKSLANGEGSPFCGGSLVTRRHVITAAHCLKGLVPRDVLVRLGSYDFDDATASTTSNDYQILDFRFPANYSDHTKESDIAIIRLKTPLEPNTYKPICVPRSRALFVGKIATVVGYGSTSASFAKAEHKLRQVSMPIWENRKCSERYGRTLSDSYLCAGYEEGGKDACQGDSGGPLMVEGENSRMMLAGVVSFGIKCALPGIPGVYTRVSNYMTWIEKNTRE